MSTADVRPNTAEVIYSPILVDSDGARLPGLTDVYVRIVRADGLWYDWVDGVFRTRASVGQLDHVLTQVDTVAASGLYAATWPGAVAGVYLAVVLQTPGTSAANLPATVDLRVGQVAFPGDAMDLVVDAVDAAAIAASGVAEMQVGLATSTAITNVAAAVAALPTAADTAVATAAAIALAHGSGSYVTATGFSTHSAADVWAVGTRTLTGIGDAGIASQGSIDALPAAPAASVVADAVWDELLAGHVIAGSASAALSLVDVAVSTRATAAAVWAIAEGTPDAGTYGYAVQLGRRLITNRTEVDTTSGGRERLFADDGTTVLLTWTLRDGAGGAIVTPTGSPARRGAAT